MASRSAHVVDGLWWRNCVLVAGLILSVANAPRLGWADDTSDKSDKQTPTATEPAKAGDAVPKAATPSKAATPRLRFNLRLAKPLAAGVAKKEADASKPAPARPATRTVARPAAPTPPDSSAATHEQVKLIRPTEGSPGWMLTCFALTKDGRIVSVLAGPQSDRGALPHGAAPAKPSADSPEASDPDKQAQAIAEIRVLDPDGKLLNKWSLDFLAQAANVGPDGAVVVAGDGTVARYSLEGKLLGRAESPQVVASKKDPGERERRARAMLEQQRNSMQEMVKNLEAQKADLEGKEDAALSNEERTMKKNIDRLIDVYKKQANLNKPQPITDEQVQRMAQQLAAQERRTNALCVSDKYIFSTGPASKGYGYRVWRTDLEFKNPVAIVDGLSGCCGQMDIQCCGDEIVVAENSRHRVVRYDSDGKQIAAWGKRDRDGGGENFGGCCNPMNTRALGDKLYVAESDGQVKLFTRDGKFEGLVGVAQVQPGCKSSTVAVSPDEQRVYYIDVQKSGICVLDRKSKDAKPVGPQAARPTGDEVDVPTIVPARR
jgi:hypothetical protein